MALLLWLKLGLHVQTFPGLVAAGFVMVLLFAITWIFFVYRAGSVRGSAAAYEPFAHMEQGVRQRPAIADWRAGPSPSSILTPPARLTVELRSNLDLRPEDAAALDTLIEGRPQAGVFLSKAWLSGFFIEPHSGIEPSLVMLREGSALRAMVPIAVRRDAGLHAGGLAGRGRRLRSGRPPCRAWIRGGLVGGLSGVAGRIVRPEGLRARAPGRARRFAALGRGAPSRQRARAAARARTAADPCVAVSRPRRGVEPAARRRAPDRSSISLDKHRRLLERRCRFRIEMLQEPGEVMAAFELLVQLLHARWHGRGRWIRAGQRSHTAIPSACDSAAAA